MVRQSNYVSAFGAVCLLLLSLISQAAQAGWQPFTIVNGNLLIDIEIAGQPATAMLDSGSSLNLISSEFISRHGLDFKKSQKLKVRGVFGEQTIQTYNNIPVKLFGSQFELDNVASNVFSGPDLLLGGGIFKGVIVQIDYPNKRIRFLDKKAVNMKKHANVPMKRAKGSVFPAIQVEANGAKVWLIFDTGNTGGLLLKRSFALENNWLTEDTLVTPQNTQGVIESGHTDSFNLDSFVLGPYELDNVAVSVPGSDQEANIGRHRSERTTGTRIKSGVHAKGLIGYDIFKHFVITIDYMAYKVNFHAP
ncbi:MAG: aspartyl protease family protein [Proteobacteria bacterium]|nr:aspartyl protease family protein [Pseudomonadota bacterium]